MSDINDTKELSEGNFDFNLILIKQHQRKELILLYIYKDGTYQKCSFRGESNIQLNLITCKDTFLFPQYSKATYYIGTMCIYFIYKFRE